MYVEAWKKILLCGMILLKWMLRIFLSVVVLLNLAEGNDQ